MRPVSHLRQYRRPGSVIALGVVLGAGAVGTTGCACDGYGCQDYGHGNNPSYHASSCCGPVFDGRCDDGAAVFFLGAVVVGAVIEIFRHMCDGW